MVRALKSWLFIGLAKLLIKLIQTLHSCVWVILINFSQALKDQLFRKLLKWSLVEYQVSQVALHRWHCTRKSLKPIYSYWILGVWFLSSKIDTNHKIQTNPKLGTLALLYSNVVIILVSDKGWSLSRSRYFGLVWEGKKHRTSVTEFAKEKHHKYKSKNDDRKTKNNLLSAWFRIWRFETDHWWVRKCTETWTYFPSARTRYKTMERSKPIGDSLLSPNEHTSTSSRCTCAPKCATLQPIIDSK